MRVQHCGMQVCGVHEWAVLCSAMMRSGVLVGGDHHMEGVTPGFHQKGQMAAHGMGRRSANANHNTYNVQRVPYAGYGVTHRWAAGSRGGGRVAGEASTGCHVCDGAVEQIDHLGLQ